jgi:hypothetical protein
VNNRRARPCWRTCRTAHAGSRPQAHQPDVYGGALSLSIAGEHLRHAVRVRAQPREASYDVDCRKLCGEQDIAQIRAPRRPALRRELTRRSVTRLMLGPDGLVPFRSTGGNAV